MTNKCDKCLKTYSDISNLRKHIKINHPQEIETLGKYKTKNDYAYTCQYCNKHFTYKRHFKFHLKSHVLVGDSIEDNLSKTFTAEWTIDSEMSPTCHLVEQVSESTLSKGGSPVSSPKKLKITAANLQIKKKVGQHNNNYQAEQTTHNAFGAYIAEQLRSLSPDMEILCKKIINDAIFEAQMGNLTRYSKIVNILPNTLSE